MSVDNATGGSEDVADFLRRIKELNLKRDEEDAERTRKLEEEIMQGRKQREARRLERARSLSPEKRDSLSRPQTPRSPRLFDTMENRDHETLTGTPKLTPTRYVETPSTEPVRLGGSDRPKSEVGKENSFPQQKPSTDTNDTNSKSYHTNATLPRRGGTLSWQQRPSSPFGTASSAGTLSEPQASKAQISQQLASKDPAWFRQAARDSTSMAYRRNREDDREGDIVQKRALPGLSQSSVVGPQKSLDHGSPAITKSSIPTTKSNVSGNTTDGATSDHNAPSPQIHPTTSMPDLRSRFGARSPPTQYHTSSNTPDRAVSPTKGLGGFVQSAMKRSDSVSKRWSVQTPTSQSRPETPRKELVADEITRPASPAIAPRAEETLKHPAPSKIEYNRTSTPVKELNVPRALKQPLTLLAVKNESTEEDSTTPSSPNKRWSPVKSSWLESALSRPSSPQAASSPTQPSWMSELNKNKQNRLSKDVKFKDIDDTTSDNVHALSSKKSPPTKPKPSTFQKPDLEAAPGVLESSLKLKTSKSAPPVLKAKPDIHNKSDGHSNTGSQAARSEEQLEFRSAFGKLRHTRTENYHAPDELKDNITRGKAALSVTDGPQLSPKKDELKESLVKQKQTLIARSVLEATNSTGNILPSVSGTSLTAQSKTTQPEPSFTSSLAAVLARGGPVAAKPQMSPTSQVRAGTVEKSSSTPLEHVTKGRARGPKRRAPNANVGAAALSPVEALGEKASHSTPDTAASAVGYKKKLALPERDSSQSERPQLPPRIRSVSGSNGLRRSPSLPSRPAKPTTLRAPSGTVAPGALLAQNGDTSAKPITSPARAGTVSARPFNRPTVFDKSTHDGTPAWAQSLPRPAARADRPTIMRKSSAVAAEAIKQSSQTDAHPGDVSGDNDSRGLIKAFFRDIKVAPKSPALETQAIVDKRATAPGNIKTLRRTISELTSDGKTTSLPPQQDHVLFNGNMYICNHIFGDEAGARVTEVYLWAGSPIPEATFDEAQEFARKTAKECGGKLYVFRQGKESSNFLQAIGGIVITRRGTMKDHKKSYMLCGRRHMGHIAFDEVDLEPSNLCSGFPYIIASPATKTTYLWKGSYCLPEELAAARLISMDIDLTSNVVEVVEGQEPPAFISALGGASTLKLSSSKLIWKPKQQNYDLRLFRLGSSAQDNQASTMTTLWNRVRQPGNTSAGAEGSTDVHEISPFSMMDIEADNIYVLDGFFELYILVGPLAQDKCSAFYTSLLFAQDYAIVAASNQDRPSVPSATVLMLEGAMPLYLQPLFRHYGAQQSLDTAALMAGKAQSTGSDGVKTMTVNDAIVAIKGL